MMTHLNIIYKTQPEIDSIPMKEIGKILLNHDRQYCLYAKNVEGYRFVDFRFTTIEEFKRVYIKLRKKVPINKIYIIEFTTFIQFDKAIELIENHEQISYGSLNIN